MDLINCMLAIEIILNDGYHTVQIHTTMYELKVRVLTTVAKSNPFF